MIESPVLQRFLREQVGATCHKLILGILEDRFGPVPQDVVTGLKAIFDEDRLERLNKLAARCPDLDAFRQQLGP
jgi:hypothetical protein